MSPKPPKPPKPPKSPASQSATILNAAIEVAEALNVSNILVLMEKADRKVLSLRLPKDLNVVFAVTDPELEEALRQKDRAVTLLQYHDLRRTDRIKHALLAALSDKLLRRRDRVVCAIGTDELDSISIVSLARESEEQAPLAVLGLSDETSYQIVETVLSLAIELGYEGREGKPLGTMFVIGDAMRVMDASRQLVFNPFRGYPEEERNVLDPFVREGIKEFAMIDGGFVIKNDGTILAAGRYFDVGQAEEEMPQGLGTRHAAAAAITKATQAIAIVVSETNGMVRVLKGGKIVLDIEQPRRV